MDIPVPPCIILITRAALANLLQHLDTSSKVPSKAMFPVMQHFQAGSKTFIFESKIKLTKTSYLTYSLHPPTSWSPGTFEELQRDLNPTQSSCRLGISLMTLLKTTSACLKLDSNKTCILRIMERELMCNSGFRRVKYLGFRTWQ